MTLSPDAAAFLEQLARQQPPTRWAELDEAGAVDYLRRAREPRALGPTDEAAGLVVTDLDPNEVRPLRVYRARGSKDRPMIVYFHGGGWVMGDLDLGDAMCRTLATDAGFTVVSASYRLAPENPFPAAFDDAYDATCWAHDNAAALGGDPSQLVVMGTSAGGNLAAAVALKAHQVNGPPIRCQALIYAVLDDRFDTESYESNAEGYFLEREQMRWYWTQYLAGPRDRRSKFAVPARAECMVGLPSALVVTAEFDPLRDEGAAYAVRLDEAGVPLVYRCFRGQIHGFLGLSHVIAEATPAVNEIGRLIRDLLRAGTVQL